jgi:hypothetical protein
MNDLFKVRLVRWSDGLLFESMAEIALFPYPRPVLPTMDKAAILRLVA